MEYIKRVQGGLLGLALGDAFGYQVEKMNYNEIIDKYGENGICDFDMQDDYARFSDDTQLALYSADAILLNSNKPLDALYSAYFDWLYTQFNLINGEGSLVYRPLSKLVQMPELNELRRPNLTCLNALFKCQMGTEDKPLNDSCDNGSLVRSAPLVMYLAKKYDLSYTAKFIKDASYITHGHRLCAISSYYLAALLHRCLKTEDRINDIVEYALEDTKAYFGDIDDFDNIINNALALINNGDEDVTNIEKIGIGYRADETIAITLYVVLKYHGDFKKALCVGANHSGKSDTVCALIGLIIGLYHGIDIIPDAYLGIIELEDLIIEYAEKLAK